MYLCLNSMYSEIWWYWLLSYYTRGKPQSYSDKAYKIISSREILKVDATLYQAHLGLSSEAGHCFLISPGRASQLLPLFQAQCQRKKVVKLLANISLLHQKPKMSTQKLISNPRGIPSSPFVVKPCILNEIDIRHSIYSVTYYRNALKIMSLKPNQLKLY